MKSISPSDILHGKETLGTHRTSAAHSSKHIAFGIDEKYARHMGVLMTSLISRNPDSSFVFHVFTNTLRPEDRARLAALSTESVTIHVYYMAADLLTKLPVTVQYPVSIYYRLLMPEILRESTDIVLYLDSDIICLERLPDFSDVDLAEKSVAAVKDVPRVAQERNMALELKHDSYFNSGVMLINTAKWIAENISEKVLAILDEKGASFTLMDQDALNLALDGEAAILPATWNMIYNLGQMTQYPEPGTLFLHYTGSIKPWRLSGRHPLSRYYRDCEARSPWRGEPLLPPAGYKEMEVYARLSLRDKDFFTGLRWYWRYLKTKFL